MSKSSFVEDVKTEAKIAESAPKICLFVTADQVISLRIVLFKLMTEVEVGEVKSVLVHFTKFSIGFKSTRVN